MPAAGGDAHADADPERHAHTDADSLTHPRHPMHRRLHPLQPRGYCETNSPPAPFCASPFCPYGPSADFCTYPQTGCPGNAFYGDGGCCRCVNQNPTCENGFVWNTDLCDCVLAPTPTPTPGGGGGGGHYCTEYYWVTYESYDGGRTWHEVDRTYVGCW